MVGKTVRKTRILFVCTGNIFRSVAADYCLNDYLKREGITCMVTKSAGIYAKSQEMQPMVIEALAGYGIDVTGHKQTKLTKEVIEKSDMLIAMAKFHQEFIKKEFNLDVPLFNGLAVKKNSSVYDVCDVVPDYRFNNDAVNAHLKRTIDYIHNVTPRLCAALQRRIQSLEKAIE